MAFLCPARIRRARKKRGRKDPTPPLPGRITGSASIDTLVRVGLEKEEFYNDGCRRQKMTILHDFMPCVEDELSVKRGETVTILYQENDWVYVIAGDGREGFIPYVYCVHMGRSIDDLHVNRRRLNDDNNTGHPPRHLADLAEEDAASLAASTLNRHKSRSLPSVHEASHSTGPYEEADGSSQAPLLGLQSDTGTGQSNWPRYENLPDHCGSSDGRGHVNAVASIEVVDVRSFSKEDSGRYITLFPYRAKEEGDVNVDRGEFVTVLNRDDPDWFWVAKSDNTEGFVPGNFLCPSQGTTMTGKLEQQTATSTGSSAASVCSQPTVQTTTELVVLYDYTAHAPDDVSVMRGEWVYADLGDQPEKDWLWVYARATSRFGFIPREFAKPPSIIRNTTTRRSNVEKTLYRAGPTRPSGLKRTMSLSERRNQTPFDPYMSP